MINIPFKEIRALIILILVLVCAYFAFDKFFGDKNSNNQTEGFSKNYGVNEYTPIYISDEKMAQLYLNDYVSLLYGDIEEAYKLLDSEYKTTKFNSYSSFKSYISASNYVPSAKDYSKSSSDGYLLFKIHDTNDNLIIFKTKGVMQYSVYFEEEE